MHSDKQSGLEVKEAHSEGKAMLLALYKLGLRRFGLTWVTTSSRWIYISRHPTEELEPRAEVQASVA